MKKHIKSIFSVMIVVCILMTIFTFNVSAASVSISGGGEYEVGKSFSVRISFSADATLYAVEADISYNSSVLRLNSVSGSEYNAGNGTIKIVDDGFTATKPSKSSSYTLNFTAIAAGNSNISASVLGGGEATSTASGTVAIKVVTPKPSSNASLASIKLSNGALSPAFNPNTTSYTATVKYSVDSINIKGAVADGKSTYTGGGTFALQVGDNQRVLTVTAEDGTKKTYTINIKRMTEQETAEAEQAERDANPLLVVIDGADYTIVNNFEGLALPAGFTQGTSTRKESEITVLNDDSGKYQLCWLTDANGKMYIVEDLGDYGNLPTGFKLSKYTLNGAEVDAFVYEDESLKDFYILNTYVAGQTAYYRFDSAEGTMQRAADFNLALTAANTKLQEPEKQSVFSWFVNMNKIGKIVFIIMVSVAVLFIALAIIFIVKIVSSKGDNDIYDEINTDANEFVLNDFADTSKSEQPIPQQTADTEFINITEYE